MIHPRTALTGGEPGSPTYVRFQFTASEGFWACWFCPGSHRFQDRCQPFAGLLVSIIAFLGSVVGVDYAIDFTVGQIKPVY